jgi:hypothetical protein
MFRGSTTPLLANSRTSRIRNPELTMAPRKLASVLWWKPTRPPSPVPSPEARLAQPTYP